MNHSLRKLVRTVQSQLYFLKGTKDSFYYHSRRLLSQPHEMEFRALKFVPDELPGSYVDVGANHGQSIESIMLLKPNARVYSFEANQLLAEKLQKRYSKRSNVAVFPYGLADEEQSRTLFVPVYRGFVYDGDASFDRSTAAALFCSDRLYRFSPAKLELKELTSTVKRLDSQNLDPIVVKIDVQGYEYEVVKGGIETLKRYEPILLLEGFHGNEKLARLVRDLGYDEYMFDEAGFYRSSPAYAINSFLMTPQRAGTVRLSNRKAPSTSPESLR